MNNRLQRSCCMLVMAWRIARPISAFSRSFSTVDCSRHVVVQRPHHRPKSLPFMARFFSAKHNDERTLNPVPQLVKNQRMTNEAFLETIRRSLHDHVVSIVKGDEIVLLVGVSGGCDSVALLHAISHILTPVDDGQYWFPDDSGRIYKVHVVHFDHKQRGTASVEDRRFVVQLCSSLRLPCHVYEWTSSEDFSQDLARQWRRSTMYSLIQSLGGGVILTAHHQDDSEETLLLKMIRGVHLTHLRGMDPVVVESNEMSDALLARPMLQIRKADIVEFLTSHNLEWREDESNTSDKYLRNRVRNELIPLLANMMGGEDVLQKRLGNVSQQSRELHDDMTRRAQRYLDKMKGEDEFLLRGDSLDLVEREAFYIWARSRMQGYALSYDQLQRILTQIEARPQQRRWTLQVGGRWNVVRNGEAVSVTKEGNEEKEAESPQQELKWSVVEGPVVEQAATHDALIIRLPDSLETAKYNFVLTNSNRTGNWHFTPPWRKNPVKLHDFLRGQKVRLRFRRRTPVILRGDELVAVLVISDGRCSTWIVDAKYNVENETTWRRIRLDLT